MKKVPPLACKDCGDLIGPTERRWDHVTLGGLRVESYCEDCMQAQVNDYAERTILGMLDGTIETRINGQTIRVVDAKVSGSQAVKPERSEP